MRSSGGVGPRGQGGQDSADAVEVEAPPHRRLSLQGAFGVERAKTLMLQLTDGMSAVHSLKISHRDLKPANIMFDEVTGIATIVDFGLSKEQNTNSTVTNSSGAKIGTVLYMSPEQTEGDVSKIGAPADVWALGVIFYEILTGQHPFLPLCLRPSPSPAAGGSSPKPPLMMSKKEEGVLVWRICEMECPPLPVTPASASLAEVVFRALKKDQDERYKDAGEMHAHLKETFASPEAPVEPEGGSARPHDSWTEIELAAFVRRLGPKFSEAAATIEEDCVNGMLWNELVKEKAITKSLADGGLGLSPLQLKRVQQELRVL
ncbi:kinase-like domain-containing protein [Baffinella frigidus]|nr:kinase-like domain-containing protein [Cryptophyta sp. CCMP2293]